MVGALETVAHTSSVTKMGEDIMTDVGELCAMMTNDAGKGQHHQPEEGPPGTPRGGESCKISMHDEMPGPIVQAHTGGIAPIEPSNDIETNECIMRERPSHTSQREMGEEPARKGQDLHNHHHHQTHQGIAGGLTSQP